MNSLSHTLGIVTLSTWLSVGAAGTVGLLWRPAPAPARVPAIPETQWVRSEIPVGTVERSAAGEAPVSTEAAPAVSELPAPPEMPATAEMSPLPEIPTIPARADGGASAPVSSTAGTAPPRRAKAGQAGGSAARSGQQGGAASGMSEADRIAAGSMPRPAYPAEARRRGQSGTVLVEFVVDDSGRVISARAVTPSRSSLLDDEAVRTVRGWKFPPGGIMTLQRPIVFELR